MPLSGVETPAGVNSLPKVTAELSLTSIPKTSEASHDLLPLSETVQAPIPAFPCELAGAGIPLDVTIPDDTPVLPGQRFVKTWRLVNLGTCVWDGAYSVVWVSGDNLAPLTSYPLFSQVPPGEAVDISIEMVAPPWQGRYTSYWMLRSPSGKLFGLGPAGNAPFWVRIQVPAIATPTILPSPTPSPTLVAPMQGKVRLTTQQGVDLESASVQSDSSAVDFWIDHSDEGLVMIPMNGAQWAIYPAAEAPSFVRCLELARENSPIPLEGEAFFPSLCVRTGSGNPANLQVGRVDRVQSQVELTYLLWIMP